MATSLARRRRVIPVGLALLAVGLLVAMALSGHIRETRQLVRFTPDGVLRQAPQEIDAVDLEAAAGRWRFRRGPDGWRSDRDGRPLPPALAAAIEDAIKFMHVSPPARVLERAEWNAVGLREFGLDPPGYTATLYRGDVAVLRAEFGAPNPQQVLQYMTVQDRDRVYLMSRFVGQEWERAIQEASGG